MRFELKALIILMHFYLTSSFFYCHRIAKMSTLRSSSHLMSSLPRKRIRKLVADAESTVGQAVRVQGWVRTIRDQKQFSFIEINDGSSLSGIQAVADCSIPTYDIVQKLTTGAAVDIGGRLARSQGKGQKYEIIANEVTLIGSCPGDEYPLQKKRHSQEFLRSIAHIRGRTNTIAAVSRVRSALAFATHSFFQAEGCLYLQSPLITSSDCEGGGEMFRVTTLPVDQPLRIKRLSSGSEATDFSSDFFRKPAFLTVSGQLSAEAYACSMGDVYTFGPTFRAENSQTSRHLAEFHMIEPELAFSTMWDAMDNAERFMKFAVDNVLSTCAEDFDFFEKFVDKTVKQRLNKLLEIPFARVSYREAVEILQAEIAKDPSKWSFPNVSFGVDLQSEHERYLAEQHFKSCVFVHNYPRAIKAFYMRDNDDGETVDSFDLLVPGVGELIGGSQREERLQILQRKLADFSLDEKSYQWYLDLRKFGSIPHAGYGVGFERLICFTTGIDNIRDAIAFPRFPGNAEF